ncbi:hypothetical protein KNE206_75500 [Kitasatospora sp. NE20-6]|uniref:SUKH-4 family immunity protein n=1 Tax=Kitasatospora sp. NE20-6 TaxID=2859066 RepID=UPI0034DC958D
MTGRDEAAVGAAVRGAADWLRDGGPGRLYVCGAAGSGKSSVLAALKAEFPAAALVDAAGRSADAVVQEIVDETGLLRRLAYGDLGELVRALRKEKRPRTILLANTHLAGTLASGGEPALLGRVVRDLAVATGEGKLRLVVEQAVPPELPDAVSPAFAARVVGLPGGGAADELRALVSAAPAGAVDALRALACAELRQVPVEGWAVLCRASSGEDVPADRLSAWADGLPWLVHEDGEVRFASAALAGELRASVTDPAAVHGRVTDLLLGGGATAEWAARSLPGHAAAAGRFDDLLADAGVLGRVPQDTLVEGFRACYRDGIVRGTHAAALHFLTGYGLAGAPHGEWIAHLAHDAFTRGESERARQLAGACPEPLLFRTLWSHWRPAGDYTVAGPVHRSDVESVTAAEHLGRPAAVTGDEAGVRLVLDAATGELLAGPVPAETDLPGLTPAEGRPSVRPAWHRTEVLDADGKPLGVFHHPEASYAGAVDGRLVLADRQGAYAVELDTALLRPGPRHKLTPVVGGHGRILPRPYDPRAVADLRGLLEETFGAGHVHRLRPEELPAGLGHAPTRRLLTDVGVPSVDHQPGLRIAPLTADGLAPRPWESVPGGERPGPGPFLPLGEWLGAALLLDGPTGRVLRMLPAGSSGHAHPREALAGTTLESFLTMVALQARYLAVYRTEGPDHRDVLDELRLWLAGADPDAAASDGWQYVTEPANWH